MRRGAVESLRGFAHAAIELFAWWRAELRDIGRALLPLLPDRKSPQALLRVGAGVITVEKPMGAGWTVVGTVPRQPDGSWPAELAGLPAELQGARVAIALERSALFFDEFALPLASERHLSAVLKLQLERRL